MTARILVVDDHPPNIRLLEARLSAEYFIVLTASNGPDALTICREGACDIVLLDVMMPGMDGLEVCRRLKSNPATSHLPVVMVTALDQPADRVKGLEAGADDFLTKPIDEVALVARVRSLARLKVVVDELRSRATTTLAPGVSEELFVGADDARKGRILLVDDRESSSERIVQTLRAGNDVTLVADANDALFKVAEENCDLLIVSLGLATYDGLRLCSQVRSLERTRSLPILAIAEADDRARVLRGLELGVNDFLTRPIDRNELLARTRTQLRQKRYTDSLRSKVQQSIELALFDPLTGLNNRRFLENHLATMIENARMRRVVRGGDLLCRLGGEEFVIAMPNASLDTAMKVAERTRSAIEQEPFVIDETGRTIEITVSVGVAGRSADGDHESLYRRADRALYRSKSEGRNRVTADAA